MPTNVTGDATGGSFPANVVAPSDGEDADASSIQVPLGQLADRTHWLRRGASIAARNWSLGEAFSPDSIPAPLSTIAVAAGLMGPSSDREAIVVIGDYLGGAEAIYVSQDGGRTYTQEGRSGPFYEAGFTAVVYDTANSSWIVVGPSGTNRYVGDPTGTWEEGSGAGSLGFLSVAADGLGRAVAVGDWSTGTAVNARYTDDGGVTWAPVTSWLGVAGGIMRSVCHGNGVWVACGNAALDRSTDGLTWSSASSITGPSIDYFRFVAYSGEFFVAIDTNGNASGDFVVWRSPDGDVWTGATVPGISSPTRISLASDGSGVMIMALDTDLYSSADHGETWSLISRGTGMPNASVAASSDRFVCAGLATAGDNFRVSNSLSFGV